MSSPVGEKSIDLSPSGLFPNKETAAQDEKCLIISKVYQQMLEKCDMTSVNQEILREDAAKRYSFLSEESKLALYQVDHGAFMLYQRGVKPETAKEYYSHRLTESDAQKWQIHIV